MLKMSILRGDNLLGRALQEAPQPVMGPEQFSRGLFDN